MNDILFYALILLITKLISELFVRIHLPAVIGIILAGILCGPVLHIFQVTHTLEFLAELGIIFLLFIAGLETNLEHMKQQGKSSFVAALFGVLVPFFMSFIFLRFNYGFNTVFTVGLILTATSVSITVMTLIEIKKLNTRSGITVLGAAVIDDMLAMILMAISFVFLLHRGHIYTVFIKFAIFIFVVFVFYFYLTRRVLIFARRFKSSESLIRFAVIIMLLFSVFSYNLGIASITGAYIAGLSIAKTPYRRRIMSKISVIVDTLFISIFFFVTGLKTSFHLEHINIGFTIVFILVAMIGKVIGSGIGVLFTGLTPIEALKIGVGMMPRGEVALVIATVGLSYNLINQQIFNSVVIMILITSILTPIILKYLYTRTR